MVLIAGETQKNKKIIFDDEGDVVTDEKQNKKKKGKASKEDDNENAGITKHKVKKEKKFENSLPKQKAGDADDSETPVKWFEVVRTGCFP